MEKEITMEELVKMVNESSGEIIIHVELGEERDSDERKTECPSNKNIGRPTKRLPMLLMERVIGRLSRTRKCMLR